MTILDNIGELWSRREWLNGGSSKAGARSRAAEGLARSLTEDDLLCVALPGNLERCFLALTGAPGHAVFVSRKHVRTAAGIARSAKVGAIVVNAVIAREIADGLDRGRSRGAAVYIAVPGPLNDFVRSVDQCEPVDFWSGRIVRLPEEGDLDDVLTRLLTGADEAPDDAPCAPSDAGREEALAARLAELAGKGIALTAGLARSDARGYGLLAGELLPEGEAYDLIVPSSLLVPRKHTAAIGRISSEIRSAGSSQRRLFLLSRSNESFGPLKGFGYGPCGDGNKLVNVPGAALFAGAVRVCSDNVFICAEAALHGCDVRLIGTDASLPPDLATRDGAGRYLARAMLAPDSQVFDCATGSFVTPEQVLGKLEAASGDKGDGAGPVTRAATGARIGAGTAPAWAERVLVLALSGRPDEALALCDRVARHFPGSNIGAGDLHVAAVLRYICGRPAEVEIGVSMLDDFEAFERYLPIRLYSLHQQGEFDALQAVANGFVLETVYRIEQAPRLHSIRSLMCAVNCFYELDQLLSSFGRSCLDEAGRQALIDCLDGLVAQWKAARRDVRGGIRSLTSTVIKLLHREDHDIPDALISRIIDCNEEDLAYLVSLLNLVNNNEIITEGNMVGRERLMRSLAGHVAARTASRIGRGDFGMWKTTGTAWAACAKLGFWSMVMSFCAVGYDCRAIRNEAFTTVERHLEALLAASTPDAQGLVRSCGNARTVSNYIKALERIALAGAAYSARACEVLRAVIVAAAEAFPADPLVQQDVLRVSSHLRDSARVDDCLAAASRGAFQMNFQSERMASDHLFALDRQDEGLARLDRADRILWRELIAHGSNAKFFKQLNDHSKDHARKRFYKSSADLLSEYPQPQEPKGVVFVLPYDAQNTLAMGVPVLAELRKRGYATHYLGDGILPLEPTGNEAIDRYHGIVGYDYTTLGDEPHYDRSLKNEWTIDWNNKILTCDGVNYFQGVFEYLANRYRRFDIDIEKAPVWKFFYTQLLKCDRAVTLLKQMRADPALKDLPVRFMAVSAQTSPGYIYKEFCAEVGYRDDMHLIFHINGYENYFSNLGTKVASTLGAGDMTVRPFIRSPLIVRREQLALPADSDVEKERLKTVLTADRVGAVGRTPMVAAAEARIRAHRARGGKVVVCYGKVLCDLGVPFDGGPAHRDIVDWVNHTIDCARGSDTLVLIKPHPHEKRPEIARHLTQTLFESITTQIPDNVMLLGHDWFNNSYLKDLMDVAILWNGTSCLEMSVWGLPVVICAHFGTIDYPVDLIAPESRADYERMIRHPEVLRQNPDSAGLAIDYLHKMGGEAVFVPYRYCPRPATNDPVGPYHWIQEDIDRWQSAGDEWIERVAEIYVRRFVPGEDGVATEADYERYRTYKHGGGTAI